MRHVVCTPKFYAVSRILDFLQQGVEQCLGLSTVKGQIAALSMFFQRPLASHSLMQTFIQGVTWIALLVRSRLLPWYLNLVLSVLQYAPFEQFRDVPLPLLSRKVAFLVAVTSVRRVLELAALSCKSLFLVLHQDKVVLRPHPSFPPKEVSTLLFVVSDGA